MPTSFIFTTPSNILNNLFVKVKFQVKHLTIFLLLIFSATISLNLVAKETTQAPAWQLKTQSGEVISSSQFEGQAVILHFWATWCSYCKKLQPTLVALEKKYADQGIKLVAISFNEDDGARPQDDITSRSFNFITAVNGDNVAELYGVRVTPTTFFIDKHNQIIYKSASSNINASHLELTAREMIK